VTLLERTHKPSTSSLPLFAQPIQWHPLKEDITLIELFAGIHISLATTIEAGLKVKCNIHVDNGVTPNQATYHHIQRLLALYPKQLAPSTIYECFRKFP